jgi:protein transport protein SEC61 subunit beta
MTSGPESGPDSTPSAQKASGSSSIARAGSPPGGPRSAIRRRAAADHKESVKNARPTSTRAAGAGGSSGTMLRLYTDESPGLKVDPMVIMFLSLGFIFSVVALHRKWLRREYVLDKFGRLTSFTVIAKVTKRFS